MMQGERDKLLKMEELLHNRVVGQEEAIRAVSDAIRRSRAGLSEENRPYGSFLFLGPTGVGKTELCKALAGFLFDSEDHLIRIDMSEFMVSKDSAADYARYRAHLHAHATREIADALAGGHREAAVRLAANWNRADGLFGALDARRLPR